MFTAIFTFAKTMLLTGATLCCHGHSDGTTGCWPQPAAGCGPDAISSPCRGGATQTDPNDEESWECTPLWDGGNA
jgi:hypothetical protein